MNSPIVQLLIMLIDRDAQRRTEQGKRDLLQKVGNLLVSIHTIHDYDRLRASRSKGTCEWIEKTTEIAQWLNEPDGDDHTSLIWIKGFPGSGKSYLAAFMIERLREYVPTAYFFRYSKNDRKRNVLGILRTLVWQLLQPKRDRLPNIAETFHSGAAPHVANMKTCLNHLLTNETSSCLILDGLDECNSKVKNDLLDICTPLIGRARLLVVSREDSSIAQCIRRAQKSLSPSASA